MLLLAEVVFYHRVVLWLGLRDAQTSAFLGEYKSVQIYRMCAVYRVCVQTIVCVLVLVDCHCQI